MRETSPDRVPFTLGADGGANTEVGSTGGTRSWAPPFASSADWYAWGRQRPRARTSASASQSLAFREGRVGRAAPRAITLTLANDIGSAPHVQSPPCSEVGCISQGRCMCWCALGCWRDLGEHCCAMICALAWCTIPRHACERTNMMWPLSPCTRRHKILRMLVLSQVLARRAGLRPPPSRRCVSDMLARRTNVRARWAYFLAGVRGRSSMTC